MCGYTNVSVFYRPEQQKHIRRDSNPRPAFLQGSISAPAYVYQTTRSSYRMFELEFDTNALHVNTQKLNTEVKNINVSIYLSKS